MDDLEKDDQDKLEQELESPYEPNSEDYTEEDVMHVMNEGNWQSWDDLIGYLRNQGLEDENLDPGEFAHFIDDIKRIAENNIPFTSDYKEVYRLAHENRPY